MVDSGGWRRALALLCLSLFSHNAAAELSPLDQRVVLEREIAENPFAILPHYPNYILFAAYNTSDSNYDSLAGRVPDGAEADPVEAGFQISFKVPIWFGLFGEYGDLYAAYTNRSYWQAYNGDISAPFRDANHEPEAWLSIRTGGRIFGVENPILRIGFSHQSNGQTGDASRSWNRLYAEGIFVKERAVFSIKPWLRLPEDKANDDNPDIEDYLGNFELRAAYKHDQHTASLMLRNNLDFDDNHGSTELTWSHPIKRHLRAYVRYFNGYGDTLIDYNRSVNRISLGFSLTDWL